MQMYSGAAVSWPALLRIILSAFWLLFLSLSDTLSPVPYMTLVLIQLSTSVLESNHSCVLDAFNAFTKQTFGYAAFGYWKWFAGEDAAEVMEQNVS